MTTAPPQCPGRWLPAPAAPEARCAGEGAERQRAQGLQGRLWGERPGSEGGPSWGTPGKTVHTRPLHPSSPRTEVPSLKEHLRDVPERPQKDQPRVLVQALEEPGFRAQTSPLPKGQPPLPPGSMAIEVALLIGLPQWHPGY